MTQENLDRGSFYTSSWCHDFKFGSKIVLALQERFNNTIAVICENIWQSGEK